MTKIMLSHKQFGYVTIDDNQLSGVFGPNKFSEPGLLDTDIQKRFDNPIGTSQLRETARGKKNVLIVTDDNTRPTPLRRLLPFILEELERAGVSREHITILIGLGTHRFMSDEEIAEKFGREIVRNYRIFNHAWNDPKALVKVGNTDSGFEVIINRLAMEADLIVSVGNIVPHATTGFSGGGKTIMPGICGESTIEDTHWAALNFSMKEILGIFENPMRRSVVDVCRHIELSFIVNAVLAEGILYDLVVGDVEIAHRIGAKKCQEVYGVSVPEMVDIVIAEGYPTDIDLRQAIKGICSADIVVKDGGVIILAADCPEGAAPQFPEFEKYGFSDPDGLYKKVEEGTFRDKLMAYTLVAIGRIISKRVRCILVSPGIEQQMVENMGFIYAPDLQVALNKAIAITQPNARVMVLREAGTLLPIVES